MGPLTPEYPGKPEYSEYAEPRRINEIANANLTTNQKVGSSSLSGCAIPRLQASTDVLRLRPAKSRSEEHTSELQSPCNLVCRLLLEKKKPPTRCAPPTGAPC